MKNEDFKSWPLGRLPKEWERPELDLVRKAGYDFNDPRDVVDIFEKKLATFAGSKYAVAVDSCTNAVFLCLEYLKSIGDLHEGDTITIPSRTYLSIPMTIKNTRCNISFEDLEWHGVYQLKPFNVYDGAVRFTEGMYIEDSLQCVSFQLKKRLPIGKGGMIFTNDKKAYDWFNMARFEGRHIDIDQWHDVFEIVGWNMYMTPDDAARGLLIFDQLDKVNEDSGCWKNYPDLSSQEVFN